MAKSKEDINYPILPKCEECENDCKKRTSKTMIESFLSGESVLYCKNFKKARKDEAKNDK